MKKYFLVTVKFNRVNKEDESSKSVSENLLIDAISFTDAEFKAIKRMEEMVKSGDCIGTFDVNNIAKKEYRDYFSSKSSDGESSWFEGKVTHTTFDNEKEREVTTKLNYLIEAPQFNEAHVTLEDEMKQIEGGYELGGIAKTKINEIIL